MKTKPLIVWIVDGPSWAWANFASACAKQIAGFRHTLIARGHRDGRSDNETWPQLSRRLSDLKADCIVAMHPSLGAALNWPEGVPVLTRLGMKVNGIVGDGSFRVYR